MARIDLGKGKFATVDDEDFESLSQFKWMVWPDHRTRIEYAVRDATVSDYGRKGYVGMHRHILGLGFGDKRCADHINHDTLDNRRANLRIATKSQNQMNQRIKATNTSGYKGVRFISEHERWRADIRVRGVKKFLGNFVRPELAYAAYCAAALEHYGEFAQVV